MCDDIHRNLVLSFFFPSATANYDSESASYNKVIPPYEREIYVITMIKIKITEHCDKLAKGEASVFGE